MRLTRAEFEQLSVDLGHFETFGAFLLRRRSVQDAWDRLRATEPEHPTVRAFAAAGEDFCSSGYALLSLCLPEGSCYHTTGVAANNRLIAQWYRSRRVRGVCVHPRPGHHTHTVGRRARPGRPFLAGLSDDVHSDGSWEWTVFPSDNDPLVLAPSCTICICNMARLRGWRFWTPPNA